MRIKTTSAIAHEISAKYENAVNKIRSDRSRTEEWKRGQIAKIQLQVQHEREQAVAERDAQVRQRRSRLEYKLFGPGSHHDDPTQIISRRDAGDRARQLETEDQAISLLSSAERVQDDTLARAIAERCFEMGWGNGINVFLEPRQRLVPAAQELWDNIQPSFEEDFADFSSMFTSYDEVRDLDSHRLERLARTADDADEQARDNVQETA